jgi:hypothetical protein
VAALLGAGSAAATLGIARAARRPASAATDEDTGEAGPTDEAVRRLLGSAGSADLAPSGARSEHARIGRNA